MHTAVVEAWLVIAGVVLALVVAGAQLRITDLDGHRIPAFVTNSTRRQLADLEVICYRQLPVVLE